MPLVKVLRNGQITMPKGFRKVLGIKEGDVLEASLGKTGVLLKPKLLIDKESILSKQGERKVKEALDAYRNCFYTALFTSRLKITECSGATNKVKRY